MSDVSGRYDAASPPSPAPATPDPGPRRGDRLAAGQGDAFQAALRDVRGRDEDDEPDMQARDARRGDDGKRKGRKGLGEGAPAASAKSLADSLARFGPAHSKAKEDDSDLSGLAQHAGGLAAAEAPAEPEAAGAIDPAAFARMVDEAAAQVQATPPGQTLKLEFTDLRAPLQGVEITRAPDGSVSIALNAAADQVTQVSRSLQALRRRLEARGLDVAELALASGTDDAAPVARA